MNQTTQTQISLKKKTQFAKKKKKKSDLQKAINTDLPQKKKSKSARTLVEIYKFSV